LGCNAGFLTTWFALEVPNGKVVAFDPYPWNAAATRAQAVLNGLHNVEVHAVGIGPRRADLTVSSTSSKTFNAEKSAFFGGNKLRLRIEPLTTFADKLPTFVKIDIEGAEHELGPSIVASGIQRGYVEMHPQFIEAGGGNPAAFLNQLRSGGFSVSPYGPDEQALTAEPAEVRAIAYYFQRSR
jgi:FkbM family methyltransferase